jgi:Spy/CpxP family protein refolding chaperone
LREIERISATSDFTKDKIMKTLIGAIALVLAVPAVAQTAPATDPHAGHAEQGKAKHDCKECCEKMKGKDGKMECKDKKAEAKPAEPGQDHGGHAH